MSDRERAGRNSGRWSTPSDWTPTGRDTIPLLWRDTLTCSTCGSEQTAVFRSLATVKLWVHRMVRHRGGSRV